MKSLLRQLNDKRKIIIMPGVYDALSAKIAEHLSFNAVFQSGYSVSAGILGMPDYGFLNAGEVVEQARKIARTISIPLIVDVDTGYGNPLTVWRLIRDLEAAGAGGVFLEDQIWPKRCGHMSGKQVISTNEYITKLKAAIEARRSKEFVIVARTDAIEPLGIAEAIRRGREYRKVGADAIFIEAPRTLNELKIIGKSVDAPLVANMMEGGKTPLLSAEELRKIGFRLVVFPLSALFATTYAVREVLQVLKRNGITKSVMNRMVRFEEFNKFVDLQKYKQLEQKHKKNYRKL
ncbi:MAG: oxaloacetate decarboxylase [Thaumarchaeota archaeon]|nr:oxaloacetate decarboxylase [Nitrososphaerota archaeon]